MDGLRARRLKVGSPLGRLIDEAGDTIVMSNYSTLLAFLLAFDNQYWELVFFYLNCGFFGEETRHKICKQLVMMVGGEISNVEVETLLSFIFLYGGVYGGDGLQRPLNDFVGIEEESAFACIAQYRIASLLGCLFTVL